MTREAVMAGGIPLVFSKSEEGSREGMEVCAMSDWRCSTPGRSLGAGLLVHHQAWRSVLELQTWMAEGGLRIDGITCLSVWQGEPS